MEISIIAVPSTSSKRVLMQHSAHDHPDSLNPPQDFQHPSQQRPPPFPLSSQRQPNRPQPSTQLGAAPRNTLSGILSNRPGNAPIPPSLQAKMMAVRPSLLLLFPVSLSLSSLPDAQPRLTCLSWLRFLFYRLRRTGFAAHRFRRLSTPSRSPTQFIPSPLYLPAWPCSRNPRQTQQARLQAVRYKSRCSHRCCKCRPWRRQTFTRRESSRSLYI